MLDINLIRTNPDLVKENIKKKFQDEKLPMVDEVLALDKEYREAIQRGDFLRNQRNVLSKQIGGLMAKDQKEEANQVKAQVSAFADELAALDVYETIGAFYDEFTIAGFEGRDVTEASASF